MSLNLLRHPEIWRQLDRKSHEGELRASPHEITVEVARQAGMKLAWPEDAFRYAPWVSGPVSLFVILNETFSLLDALRQAMAYDGEVILEPDRIRILPRNEALMFWRAWWSEEQKKLQEK